MTILDRIHALLDAEPHGILPLARVQAQLAPHLGTGERAAAYLRGLLEAPDSGLRLAELADGVDPTVIWRVDADLAPTAAYPRLDARFVLRVREPPAVYEPASGDVPPLTDLCAGLDASLAQLLRGESSGATVVHFAVACRAAREALTRPLSPPPAPAARSTTLLRGPRRRRRIRRPRRPRRPPAPRSAGSRTRAAGRPSAAPNETPAAAE